MAIKKKRITKEKGTLASRKMAYNRYARAQARKGATASPWKAWNRTKFGPITEYKGKKKKK